MSLESTAIAATGGRFLLRHDDAELPIYSLAKTLIASTVFEAGIDIDAPISGWIGADWVPRCRDVRVRHLLNHTSGLRDYGALPEYAAAIASGGPPWSDEDFADHTLRMPLLFEPGSGWSYSNPGYWLLKRIVELETSLDLEAALRRFVIEPLGLERTRVMRGVFAEDLPWYPAEWVWHGLVTSCAGDMVRFMASPLVTPLRRDPVPVPIRHPSWVSPHNGYGLMIEPGVRYGHTGGGPGYAAACFHYERSGLTGCVLMRTDREEAAPLALEAAIAEHADGADGGR